MNLINRITEIVDVTNQLRIRTCMTGTCGALPDYKKLRT